MKNQYFGDINDYRKYGLLRLLSNDNKLSTAICWMLTADDGRTDGKFIDFLNKPSKWRHYDPALFNVLYNIVLDKGRRDVVEIENSSILPSTKYFSKILTDLKTERSEYFKEFHNFSSSSDLIFFDPDNGIEIKSKKCGNKDSSKFLYWDEISHAYSKGHSLLIYQHFQRVKRDDFINTILKELAAQTGTNIFFTFRTTNVVFFLVPQKKQLKLFSTSFRLVNERWKNQISAGHHIIK